MPENIRLRLLCRLSGGPKKPSPISAISGAWTDYILMYPIVKGFLTPVIPRRKTPDSDAYQKTCRLRKYSFHRLAGWVTLPYALTNHKKSHSIECFIGSPYRTLPRLYQCNVLYAVN